MVVGLESFVNPSTEQQRNAYIDVSFHPKMKPYLLKLQERYTTYDVRNILKLPSSYSIRIYELLKQYQKIGHRTFLITELKDIIGVREEILVRGKKTVIKDTYERFGNFRQRVLDKAQKDLEAHTDIRFDYEPIKKGRSYYKIKFTIHKNEPERIAIERAQKNASPLAAATDFASLHAQVQQWVTEAKLQSWIDTHSFKQVQDAVRYTLKQLKDGKKIKNVGGYLHAMVQQPVLITSEPVIEPKADTSAIREHYQQELKSLSTQRHALALQITLEHLNAMPELKEELMQRMQRDSVAKYDTDQTLEENFTSNKWVHIRLVAITKTKHPELFTEPLATLDAQIKTTKRTLDSL